MWTKIKEHVSAKQDKITISTVEPTPTDGRDGDVWMVYEKDP